MKRLVWFSKQLWREAFCFVSMIAFITSTVVFLILLVAAAMAFCFAVFFLVSFDRLIARRQHPEKGRSIFYSSQQSEMIN